MADSAICVAVRSRPLLKNEAQSSDTLSFEGNSTVHLQKKTYTFDYVFRPGVTNETVYNAVVAEKIRPIFEGYNVTILAYGPTGSGKTYTMGTDYNPKTTSNPDIGIIPRGISEIFRVIESQKDSIDFSVKVSFLELYREEIFDLLQKTKTACSLREDAEGIRVVNLTEVPVESVEEAFVTLEKGSNLRHTSATAKNLKSSRSHAIFSVYIEQTDKRTFNFKRSKFQLVDLAGSERMSSSKTAGLQVKEGININLGLLSLGKVITHLIEEKQHIPYRDSKLTRLLQDSLGGNSHTVMIACVNPSATSTEETLSTLRYASNTRRIKNRPVVNVDPPAVQIEKLKKQVEALQTALYEFQSRNGSATYMPSLPGDGKASKAEELQVELHDAFSRISNLVDRITKLEDKGGVILDNIQSLYEKIKLLVTEMTAAADPTLKDHLVKLEEIQSHCFQLMISANVTNFEYDESVQSAEAQSSSLEESEESENLNPASELELKTLEEMNDKQKARSENLESINRTLNMKYDQVKNMAAFFQNYETTVNEDYINTLINQIQELVQEKNKLQEHMKVAEERVRTESQQKIENYEKQISTLQMELRRKKVVLQAKEENQAKINQLLKEINDLKRAKVQLVKQMKQDCNKYLQKQREKEREVAKLVREGRRKEHELVKMKNKFEREVNVLKQKIDRVTSAKNREMKKNAKNGVIKSRTSIPQENIEEWIIEELKNKINEELAKRQCETLEKESESLKQQIKSMEELSESDAEATSTNGPDINSQKALVEIIDKRIAEIKESVKAENGKTCPILGSLNSMGQAKAAIETLFKKCVSEAVETEILQVNYQEQLKKEQSNEALHAEKISSLEHDIEKLNKKIDSNKLEQEQEKAALKYEYDIKIMHLLAEFQVAIKSAVGSEADPALMERVEAQEREIQRLQYIHQDYDHKCKEVAMLQQQLFQAKKGKKATWLGNITQSVIHSSASTSPEDKPPSMLEEFLSDSADESFGNDENDPDWRLTPAYKRQKELRARKEARKRRHPEEPSQSGDTSDTSSPKKKSSICRCRTDCKSMRCVCRKHHVKCNDQCGCSKESCLNIEKIEATLGEESLVITDVKQLSFTD
ncbi:chromosome-associated kinesin KIF4-like [Argiope bruennichi]|uniref:Chromosome-associated kinesin KIF4 like protein n=1 Tax=Argiope bruennichi TaxID=94029 RepID=A0A8T0FHT4_ARGBR|nr:chromosome-associated kinesin KIF4-like [Argiope bruennichi]KAF8790536.1 Chromosome-associated kinesin KIF4 like protein [Argiope bruennichi]